MGKTNTTNNSTQQATPTNQYQGLLNNEMSVSNANVGNQMSVNNNSANLINSLLTGTYSGAGSGISSQQNQSMVNQSLRDIAPQFQTSGILNSGEAGQIATQTGALVSNQNAQFNVQAAQNLMNAGLGGSSAWSGNAMSGNQVVGNQLAGLNKVTGSSVQTQNPFLNTFYSGLGNMANMQTETQAAGQAGGSIGSMFGFGCWVASEIFGGWYAPKTILARFYINNLAPQWFKNLYLKHGEKVAEFIHNKPILKMMLRPLFEMFAMIAKNEVNYAGF
jgi:hypothetical protein